MTAFGVAVLPVILRATARAVAVRRLPLEEAAAQLRAVPLFRVRWMRQPERLAGTVERVLRFLPPWSQGRCLRRTMILMDLWARCGLEPRLHLGFDGNRRGHAWLTAGEQSTADHGYTSAVQV